ncbi:O-methyltransferase [Boeremia exigua]|uniref:O-methyltransferase n=1 Tax=Boeremia exigua TaxID=749465 RepID=UPI001E8E4C01|nr:O-methyltransferase [Boeremia exigua]KAH6638143.1 O-methyltransferase [Boeremia exigua]
MTSTPPPSQATLDILSEINTLGDALKTGAQGAREGLLAAASRLTASLQHPTENALQLLWAQPTHLNVIRLAVEIKLFQAMTTTPAAGESSTSIAARCEPRGAVDPVLVARMLRHLAAMSTVLETGPDRFAPTATSLAYAAPNYQDTVLYIVDNFQPALDGVPAFFRANGFQAPTSSVEAPFQHAFEKGVHYFEYFERFDQEMGRRFASMMDVWSMGRQRWFDTDYYPVAERLIEGAETPVDGEESVFLVDVGGGTGHDIKDLRAAFNDQIPGKLILQDRPEIIEHAQIDARDTKTPHDFLTEQPIKGARAYFLHSIIQDWSDPVNTQILSSLVPALKRGYSKVLINDFVVPNAGAHWSQTALDWELMAALGSRHRTEAEHAALYARAGLKIVGMWRHAHSLDSLIELELA